MGKDMPGGRNRNQGKWAAPGRGRAFRSLFMLGLLLLGQGMGGWDRFPLGVPVAGGQELQLGGVRDQVLLATHERCPYGFYDAEGRFDGTAVRVVRYAFKRMDLPLCIVVVPWKRAQLMTWSGQADGFFAASRNDEREERGVLSAVIADQKWNWYLLQESPLDPLAPGFRDTARVAAFQGANMLHWLQDNQYNVVAHPGNTGLLLDMLLDRRIGAALASDQAMERLLEERGLQGRIRTVFFQNRPLSVCFSREFAEANPGLIRLFNAYVREYRLFERWPHGAEAR